MPRGRSAEESEIMNQYEPSAPFYEPIERQYPRIGCLSQEKKRQFPPRTAEIAVGLGIKGEGGEVSSSGSDGGQVNLLYTNLR
jgi:hypothetical protein